MSEHGGNNIVPMPRANGPVAPQTTTAVTIPEAPTDGQLYGRRNAQWYAAMPITGGVMNGSLQMPQLLINRNSPFVTPPAAVGSGALRIIEADGAGFPFLIDTFAANGTIGFRRAAGTMAAPLPLNDGDQVIVISARGCYQPGIYAVPAQAHFQANADGAWSATSRAMYFNWDQTLPGTVDNPIVTMTLRNGALRVGNADPLDHAAVGSLVVKANGAAALPAPPPGANQPRFTVGWLSAPDTLAPQFLLDGYGGGPRLVLRTANGTGGAPVALPANTNIGAVEFSGYATSGYPNISGGIATIICQTTEPWSDSTLGCQILIGAPVRGTAQRSNIAAFGDYGLWLYGPGTLPAAPSNGALSTVYAATQIMQDAVGNAYVDSAGTWHYLAAGGASRTNRNTAGEQVFYSAASGTAGGTIAWQPTATILAANEVAAGNTGQTALSLLVSNAVGTTVQRVSLGAAGSGGTGFRALVVPN